MKLPPHDFRHSRFLHLGMHGISRTPNEKNHTHPDVLREILQQASAAGYSFDFQTDEPSQLLISLDDGRRFDHELTDLFEEFKVRAIFFVCENEQIKSYPAEERFGFFTDENIDWLKKNHVIGCHTSRHVCMQDMDLQEQEEELIRNIESVTRIFERHPTVLAYPWGRLNRSSLKVLRKLDFQFAFLAAPAGWCRHRYLIPRLFIDNKHDEIISFADFRNRYKRAIPGLKLAVRHLLAIGT